MRMTTEHSAGGVVYTYLGGKRLYVVVSELDGHTGLPKGHIEPGETPRQAALREIREETGLRAALHADIQLEESYALPRGGEKHVVYFLAYFDSQPVRCDKRQVKDVSLVPFPDALSMLTFPGARRILTEADEMLEGMRCAGGNRFFEKKRFPPPPHP